MVRGAPERQRHCIGILRHEDGGSQSAGRDGDSGTAGQQEEEAAGNTARAASQLRSALRLAWLPDRVHLGADDATTSPRT
ncbi:uncharacterized protein IUM83_12494 [Phytophthora cinnamomi]|uniref:uncharacterized protein n=1 Tax=Phytophthora cinnamomi TaxID=4785 RepID=UPI00355A2353|nr:hypothetical protein IUM83_12494 [Phytophthora cinnamomi]